MNVDLQDKMPPLYDQAVTPWCSNFSAKSLLDYNIHIDCINNLKDKSDTKSCDYNSNTMLSPVDLFSVRADADPTKKVGTDLSFSESTYPIAALEGAQINGCQFEKDRPFDQALFTSSKASNALLSNLSTYYESGGKIKIDKEKFECPSSLGILPAEQLSGIQKILKKFYKNKAQEKENQFLDRVYQNNEAAAASKARPPYSLPFNITSFSSPDDGAFDQHILSTLSSGQPITTSLCVYDLEKGLNMDVKISGKDKCGSHAMTIIGFQKTADGKCQVHLRNSWGNMWPNAKKPQKNGDGNIWVDAKTYLASRVRKKDGSLDATLVSIEKRPAGSPIKNTIIDGDNLNVGPTLSGSLNGLGKWTSKDSTQEGNFKNGSLDGAGSWTAKDFSGSTTKQGE